MIRFAEISDIPSIISLWNEAFGDSESEIRFFLDNRFTPENTVVFEENKNIVSMLFLLEGDLSLKSISYPSYYLYAACTAKTHRGRGLMGEILEFARNVAVNRNKYFICLMPGEESLFDFYKKYGYKTVFSRKILTVEKSKSKTVNNGIFINELNSFATVRKDAFINYNRFDWDDSAIKFAIDHHRFYGGKAISACNGYVLYSESDAIVSVKEFSLHHNLLCDTAFYLMNLTGKDTTLFNLPAEFPVDSDNSLIKESGMALPVKSEYNKIIEGITNAYLGLTLD